MQKYHVLSPVPAADDSCWTNCFVESFDSARRSLDGSMAVVKHPVGVTECAHDHEHNIVGVFHHPREFDVTPDWSNGSILEYLDSPDWVAEPDPIVE